MVVALMLTPASAQAEDNATSLLFLVQTDDVAGKGNSVISNQAGTHYVVAQDFPVVPLFGCDGDGCISTRPARIEILRARGWVTWSSGSLAELRSSKKSLSSRRTTTITLRPVLPAHDRLAAVAGPATTFDFRPRTGVRLSGSAYIRPSRANGFMDVFRPGRGTITVQVTPAAVGRRIVIRDAGVDGDSLLAQMTTDARGRATFRGNLSSVSVLDISVRPTPKRAGWQIRLAPSA